MKQTLQAAAASVLMICLLAAPVLAQSLPLRGNTPDLETMRRNLPGATAMPPNTSLRLQIVLKVRNKDAFDKLADKQNDPNSPYYHHQFSQEELAREFGPSQSDYRTVEQWLIGQGFQITSVDERFLWRSITFSGEAARAERAFQTKLVQSADGKWFSNTADPQIPANLAGMVGYIGGLSNLGGTQALLRSAPAATPRPDAPHGSLHRPRGTAQYAQLQGVASDFTKALGLRLPAAQPVTTL